MPFSGTTFSVINSFVGGTTISSSQVNQNYSDIASGLTAIASGTQYLTKIELGNASDTTLARVSAGRVSIEGGAGSLYLATIDLGSATDTTLSRSAAGQLAIEGGAGSLYAATIELGAASDTTLSRASAGNVNIEGNLIYRAGGTDVPIADGGTGASTNTAAAANLLAGGVSTVQTGALVFTRDGGGVNGNTVMRVQRTDSGTGPNGAELIDFFGNITGSPNQIGSITIGGGGGGTDYNTTSDGRLKPVQHRRPIADSGEVIDALNPIYFRWATGQDDFGYIAQEAYAVNPLFARPGHGEPGDDDFRPWMMEKGRMEAIHTAELKSLRERIAALEALLVVK